MIDWIKAARLRTLPLSMSGIVLGSFLAKWRLDYDLLHWDVRIFVWAMIVTLLYQVLSNFANDYGDSLKGTDSEHRVGPTRAVQSGNISPKQMRNAVVVTALLSLAATVYLLRLAFDGGAGRPFYTFLGLGVASILAAVGYTVGKKPYGYMGLGDIFVFLFFGLVSVCGSYFLFTKSFDADILLPASAIGFFSVAVLNLNNMRDIHSDRLTGKHTLALRIGFKRAMIYEIILLQLPLLLMLAFLLMNHVTNIYAYIFMILMFPLMAIRRRILEVKEPRELDPFLKQVGIMTLAMAVLVAAGINYFK